MSILDVETGLEVVCRSVYEVRAWTRRQGDKATRQKRGIKLSHVDGTWRDVGQAWRMFSGIFCVYTTGQPRRPEWIRRRLSIPS